MGLFDKIFGKKKENPIKELAKIVFPNGSRDIEAGTAEVLWILNNSVSTDQAREIFSNSASLCAITEKFDKERLELHLNGYCKGVFSEKQLEQLYGYLVSRTVALAMKGNLKRMEGGGYSW